MRITAVQELLANAIIAKCDGMPMSSPTGFTKKEEITKLEYRLKKAYEQLATATGNAPLQASLTKGIRNLEDKLRVAQARTDARKHSGMGEEKALREDLTQAHRALERAIRTRDAEAIKELREEIAKIESKMRGDASISPAVSKTDAQAGDYRVQLADKFLFGDKEQWQVVVFMGSYWTPKAGGFKSKAEAEAWGRENAHKVAK